MSTKFVKVLANFDKKKEKGERCKGLYYVDLGESFPTSIYLQNLASIIQPRTSPKKFGKTGKRDFEFSFAFSPVRAFQIGSQVYHVDTFDDGQLRCTNSLNYVCSSSVSLFHKPPFLNPKELCKLCKGQTATRPLYVQTPAANHDNITFLNVEPSAKSILRRSAANDESIPDVKCVSK